MPHSLRAKIKSLRYKGIITDKDCDRLCKALDNEGMLDKIRAEIKTKYDSIPWRNNDYDDGWVEALEWVLDDVIGE